MESIFKKLKLDVEAEKSVINGTRRHKGLLFMLSAPSGVGKSTLAKAIIKKGRRFSHSVSYTTRPPRPGEKRGLDYHFVSKEKFYEMERSGKFLEHAMVHGALYGTPKATVENALLKGNYLILTVDVQGCAKIKSRYPDQALQIFILPPNIGTWIARLQGRKESNWKSRMVHAREELAHIPKYDYIIVNDHLEHACEDFLAIARAEEIKRNKKELILKYQSYKLLP